MNTTASLDTITSLGYRDFKKFTANLPVEDLLALWDTGNHKIRSLLITDPRLPLEQITVDESTKDYLVLVPLPETVYGELLNLLEKETPVLPALLHMQPFLSEETILRQYELGNTAFINSLVSASLNSAVGARPHIGPATYKLFIEVAMDKYGKVDPAVNRLDDCSDDLMEALASTEGVKFGELTTIYSLVKFSPVLPDEKYFQHLVRWYFEAEDYLRMLRWESKKYKPVAVANWHTIFTSWGCDELDVSEEDLLGLPDDAFEKYVIERAQKKYRPEAENY